MQQTFTCPNCGSQNVVGQPVCGACGHRLQYKCPHCSSSVDATSAACPACGGVLDWPTTQQRQPSPTGATRSYQGEERVSGKARDLVEKLQAGELTPKEALKGLEERRLVEREAWDFIPWVVYFVLCLLPAWSTITELRFLEFFAQLPAVRFPAIVAYFSLVLVAIATCMVVWQVRSHRTRGGLKKPGEAIIFYRVGLYRVMRHPAAFGGMMWPILLPIILSAHVPFTILSVAAIVLMIVYFYYGCYLEEKLSLEKWGDEYRQYMEEVPRFNFIKGLWNLRRRGR